MSRAMLFNVYPRVEMLTLKSRIEQRTVKTWFQYYCERNFPFVQLNMQFRCLREGYVSGPGNT